MYKKIALFISLAACTTAHAEWFQIKSVSSYNRVTAIRPNAPNNEITIRIKNLENIEDIQQDKTKVLLSGTSAQQLASDCLKGQLVWIENMEEESGIYVGNIYVSYEQVIRGFAKQRMVGGQAVTPELKKKIGSIVRSMLNDLDTKTYEDGGGLSIKAYETAKQSLNKDNDTSGPVYSYDSYYQNNYLRAIFVYETLDWYKKEGQFLPIEIQERIIGWLGQYQTAQGARAGDLEMKIRDLTVRYELYKDFIFD